MNITDTINAVYSTAAAMIAPKYSSLNSYSSSLLRSVRKDANAEMQNAIDAILASR